MVYLGADHRGFYLKEKIKKYLEGLGYKVVDLGNKIFDPKDDYPDFAKPVALKVAKNPAKDKGILFCGSGNGMAIAANKARGVRAILGFNEKIARMSREHNDANVLCLPADFLKFETAKKIVKIWLDTSFSKEARHIRRLKKIERMEKPRKQTF